MPLKYQKTLFLLVFKIPFISAYGWVDAAAPGAKLQMDLKTICFQTSCFSLLRAASSPAAGTSKRDNHLRNRLQLNSGLIQVYLLNKT